MTNKNKKLKGRKRSTCEPRSCEEDDGGDLTDGPEDLKGLRKSGFEGRESDH